MDLDFLEELIEVNGSHMGRYWITVNGKIIDPDEDKVGQEARALAQKTSHNFMAEIRLHELHKDSICESCNLPFKHPIHLGRVVDLIYSHGFLNKGD